MHFFQLNTFHLFESNYLHTFTIKDISHGDSDVGATIMIWGTFSCTIEVDSISLTGLGHSN